MGLIPSDSQTIKYAEIFERDFKIETVFGGCIRQNEVECYDLQMRKLLVSKFGEGFYKKVYDEVN